MKKIIIAVFIGLLISCGGNENSAIEEHCGKLTEKHFDLSDPAERTMAKVFYAKCVEIYSED